MVFILSAFWRIRIKSLWKPPDGRDWLWGKLQGKWFFTSSHHCAKLCPTLCDPMDCSLSVPGILQARTLEWVAIFSSRWFSLPGTERASLVSCVGRQALYHTTWQAPARHHSFSCDNGLYPLEIGRDHEPGQSNILQDRMVGTGHVIKVSQLWCSLGMF